MSEKKETKQVKYSFTDTKPSRRHEWRFESKEEIANILAGYLRSKGESVPTGEQFVGGIEPNNYRGDNLTLYVTEDLSKA